MKKGHLPKSIAFFQLSSFKFSLYVLLLLFQGNNQLLFSVSSRETHSEPIFLEGITWAQPPWRKVWRVLKNQKQNYHMILQFHSWAYIWRKRLIWKDICTPMFILALFITVQTFSSVAQSCPTLCDPMNCSMPGLPVHHHLPEFTHVHRVGDAIQPSHPLSSPSPPGPRPSQHQSLFQWVNSSHEVAKVLEFQL